MFFGNSLSKQNTPIFPKEWLDLRLEFTEEYLLDRKRRKQMQEFYSRFQDEVVIFFPKENGFCKEEKNISINSSL